MTDGNTGTTVVYWRKMCGFCARLLGELEQLAAPLGRTFSGSHGDVGIESGEAGGAVVTKLLGANRAMRRAHGGGGLVLQGILVVYIPLARGGVVGQRRRSVPRGVDCAPAVVRIFCA